MNSFALQAYIPKSCGKPLMDYFRRHPRFKPDILTNYQEFKSQLERQDMIGGSWIHEPMVGPLLNSYFMTDECGFHNEHLPHHYRLKLSGKFEIDRIGSYSSSDAIHIFDNKAHQDSSASHRCVAYITDNHYEKFDKYIYTGILSVNREQVSEKKPLKTSIKNTVTNPSYSPYGAAYPKKNDTTIIEASAAAGYPYIPGSPDIDIRLKMTIIRGLQSDTCQILFEGEHNLFPAYELLFNDQCLYSYDPLSEGQTGPNPYNLNASKIFHRRLIVNAPMSKVVGKSNMLLK